MSSGITVKNGDKIKKMLKKHGTAAIRALAAELFKEGEGIMTLSKEAYVPVDLGALKNSGHVQLPKITLSKIVVVLGYGGSAAPYAVFVHEDLEAFHPGGGQAKYLEIPTNKAKSGMSRRLAAGMKRRLK